MNDTALVEVPNGGWDERLRVFRAGEEVDTFALVAQRYVVLVDTMSTPALAAGVLGAVRPDLEGRQLLVINTHADYDHCWGNATFATPDGLMPAPIIAHERARDRLRSPEAREYLAERQRQEPRFATVRLVEPTLTFTDRMCVLGGDLTIELIPTPGHTVDHVAVWVPELRLLLAGDAAEHPFPCVHDEEPALPILLASIRSLMALNAAMVVPCHGGTTDPALLARNLAYFAELDLHARRALAEGQLPPDWSTCDDLPDLIGLPYEQVVRDVGADLGAVPAFYRLFHLKAVRATFANLLAQVPA